MTSELNYTRQVYFKAYEDLLRLEQDLFLLRKQKHNDENISILGKASQFYVDTHILFSQDTEALKNRWKKILGYSTNLGSFINPELGNVLIIGALASSFLYAIDGKTLGMLSAGPYGILRGIGATETEVVTHLRNLYNDHYILIFRGSEMELKTFKKILETKVND